MKMQFNHIRFVYHLALSALCVALASGCARQAQSSEPTLNEVAVIVPPFTSDADLALAKQRLVELVLASPPGTRFDFISSVSNAYLTPSIMVPVLNFNSEELKIEKLTEPLENLARQLDTMRDATGGEANVLKAVEHITGQPNTRPRAVLILPSPLHTTVREPAFSMTGLLVPTGGAILASVKDSVYGTREKRDYLRQVTVHFCHPPNVFSNAFHELAVRSFWANWVSCQGGTVASFASDWSVPAASLLRPNLPSVMHEPMDPNDTRIALVEVAMPPVFMERAMQQLLQTNGPGRTVVIPEMAGRVGCGATWEAPVDADVYVWAKGDPEPVFYNRKTNALQNAVFGIDRRTRTGRDAEWVTLNGGVDRLEDLEFWVNYFKGTNTLLKGTAIFCWGGTNYNAPFEIASRNGNEGRERGNRANSPCWTRIDLVKMVSGVEQASGGLVGRPEQRAPAAAQASISQLQAAVELATVQKEQAEARASRERGQARLDQQRATTQAKFETLLAAADSAAGIDVISLSNKLTLYQKAGDVAKTSGLPIADVEQRIQVVQQQLDRLLVPTVLPVGCRAEITRVSLSEPPFAFVDLLVTTPTGQPLRGLEPNRDFQIACDGRAPKAVQGESVKNSPPPFYLVLALDESLSMRKPLAALKEAAKTLLADLAGNERLSVQVVAFNDKTRVLCDWTTDKTLAASTIDQLKPKGETALYDAVASAAETLKERDGERRLLLFSDGEDTSSRSAAGPVGLAKLLRDAGIQTYSIGLGLSESNKRVLCRFADQHLDVRSPDQLRTVFQDARARLVREVYRLLITVQSADTMPRSFHVKVGGVNSVVAEGVAVVP